MKILLKCLEVRREREYYHSKLTVVSVTVEPGPETVLCRKIMSVEGVLASVLFRLVNYL